MAGEIPSIPGVQVPEYAAQTLRQLVATLVHAQRTMFPGSQPVSFTREHLRTELLNEDYFVCEKSDGVRVLVLMLVDKGYHGRPLTYIITRKNEYFIVPNAHFPLPESHDFSQYHHQTLIDAELVIDIEDGGKQVRKLLGFDTLAVNGLNCMTKPLTSRLGYLNEHVVNPFNRMRNQLSPSAAADIPFVAEVKDFRHSYSADYVHNEIIPHLKHESDGLIFTSVASPYVIGTCEKIMKWKPANENSVDFKARLVPKNPGPDQVRLLMWQGSDSYVDYGPLAIRPEDWPTTFPPGCQIDGRIIEVSYDPDYYPPAEWRFMRFREDKDNGNHASVVARIRDSINDGVDLAALFAECVKIEDSWKRRNPKA